MIDYNTIYKKNATVTPLQTDCGVICDASCCKGDESLGMALFPGEEKFFELLSEDWYSLQRGTDRLKNEEAITVLVCRGSCPREKRPLGCRIFPLIPYITEDDILEIRPDLRALTLCPLLQTDTHVITEEFIDVLYDVFDDLIEDERVLEYIHILTHEQNELEKFFTD